MSRSDRIDRYQIVKTLGEGSFGKVKLAYHLATNSRVALKIINRKTLAKSDMQGRIEREISYLRLLRHPHIIKLYEVIKSQDEIVMVMEFAGKELFDYIVHKGKLHENEARAFFQQIISAIDYCHRHKIVHRDLKPENLLLDENLDIKIADFGLSNIMTDGNFLKTSCGSPNYAAPEVISGRLYAGPEVDVWSCGVILYVMMCGRLPFDDESIPELFQKISNGNYTIPDYVSLGARNLLQKMLVVNSLQRITVAGILEDEWFQTDLPEYLVQSYESSGPHQFDAKTEALQTLSKTLGYPQNIVVDALNSGSNPEIQDAYKLLMDNSQLRSQGDPRFQQDAVDSYMAALNSNKNSMHQPQLHHQHHPSSRASSRTNSPRAGSASKISVPSAFPFDSDHLGPIGVSGSTIAVLPQSLPQFHLAYMKSRGVSMTHKLSPTNLKKSKNRWHFGIRSRSYPLDVMSEIYRALQNLGAHWTKPETEDIWTIHVKWQTPHKDDGDAQDETHLMTIQLYQLEQNNYLVDFKYDGTTPLNPKLDDEACSAYPFLRLATRLIMELAVNSQQ